MNWETVLIIEDDDEIRNLLRDGILKPAGYRVLEATDGQKGLEAALTDKPDLLLLDLNLPIFSGLDLLNKLKQQHCYIPTIVLTAYSSERAILKAFRLGAKDFLQKPFGVKEVRSAIENALAEERLRREKENLTRALAQANQRLQQQVHNWVALNDIAQAITSTLEETEVFRRVIENVNRILQVEAGSLLLLDRETDRLTVAITIGTIGKSGDPSDGTESLSDPHLRPGRGIADWVALHGEPLLIPNARDDPRFHVPTDQTSGFQPRSILCVPLKAKDRVIGVIEVINKQESVGTVGLPFSRQDLESLTTLASWVAVAVENARLNRATREIAATTMLRQTVTTLAHHINNRLMSLLLELDSLETGDSVAQETTSVIIASARRNIQEISAVVKALDRLEEIHTVPYVGTAEMIDIEEALDEQLRRAKVKRET